MTNPLYFHKICKTCGHSRGPQAIEIDVYLRYGIEHGLSECSECASLETYYRQELSDKLKGKIYRKDDERRKGPDHETKEDVKVRFDTRVQMKESFGFDDHIKYTEIRFQMWDDRLLKRSMRLGNEVPWCSMRYDNPAFLIMGSYHVKNQMNGEMIKRPPTLLMANELFTQLFDDDFNTGCFRYGAQNRRMYTKMNDPLLKKMVRIQAKRNTPYSHLRAEHIRCLAYTLIDIKKMMTTPL